MISEINVSRRLEKLWNLHEKCMKSKRALNGGVVCCSRALEIGKNVLLAF